MKKYLLAAAIIASSFNSYSQETKPTGRETDLLQNQKVDSTDIPLISIKDLELTLQSLSDKVSHSNFLLIQQAFQQALQEAVVRKQKSIKSPKK